MPIKNALANWDKMLGHRLRVARIQKGLVQEALAVKIAERLSQITGNDESFTFQQIQKYENGSNRIATSTLMLIADVLSMPMSSFIDNTPDRSSQDSLTRSFSPQTLRAAVLLEKLPSETVIKLIGLLENIAGLTLEEKTQEKDAK